MEIRNLMSFVQVAELNNFTKAAELLGYSQSTVSFQIKQLEEELGCLLFERVNHKISLTERGRALLEYAQSIKRLTEEFSEQNSSQSEPSETLHILAPDSVCEDMLTANYKRFHEAHPTIDLKFTSADTSEMFAMLNRNEADLMLTLDERIYQSEYVIAKEEPVEMHLVTGVGSEYARADKLSLSDLEGAEFILTEKSIGYRRVFDKLLAKESIAITPVLELGRTDIITSLLESGVGISFLPDFVTERAVREGKLTYLPVCDLRVDIWKQLLYHRKKWISRGMKLLLDFIKENEFKISPR